MTRGSNNFDYLLTFPVFQPKALLDHPVKLVCKLMVTQKINHNNFDLLVFKSISDNN